MARLLILKDGVEIQAIDLAAPAKNAGGFVVGRAESADIRLDDRSVGREHAVLAVGAGGVTVQKKTKFGKLLVNGVDVGQAVLKAGEAVEIAGYRIVHAADEVSSGPVEAAATDAFGAGEVALTGGAQTQEIAVEAEGSLAEIESVDAPEPAAELAVAEPFQTAGVSAGQESSGIQLESASGAIPAAQPEPGAASFQLADPGAVASAPDLEAPALAGFGELEGEKTAILPQGKIVTKLVFKPGEANVEEFVIRKGEITIGRGSNCDIVIQDGKSSRKHLTIRRVAMNFVALDQGSANGTYVNGVRISEQELAGDDVIRIGSTEFTFKAMNQEYFDQEAEFVAATPDPVPEALPMPGLGSVSTDPNIMLHQAQLQGPAPDAQFGAVPGIGTGSIPGLSSGPRKKETLLEKFKRQPPVRKVLIVAVIGTVLLLAVEEPKPSTESKKAASTAGKAVDPGFEQLPREKQQFVMNNYDLASEHFKNLRYNEAIFEIDKLLVVLPNGYKDAKDLKAYALRAIEEQRRAEDEKRRKEEEQRIKNEVIELVAKAQELVDQSKDDEAKDIFAQVFERDPDNPTILRLRQLVEDRETQRLAEEEAAREREVKRKMLEGVIANGERLLDAGKYYEAIDAVAEAPLIYSEDEGLLKKAEAVANQARATLRQKSKPHLEAGRSALSEGDYPKARDAFYRVLEIDSKSEEAAKGLEQVRETLHDRAKKIYTEAIVLEGLSQFESAKAKFRQCLDLAMQDDIYHGRCTRKYKRLEPLGRSIATADEVSAANAEAAGPSAPVPVAPTAGSDPQKPVFESEASPLEAQ